LIQIPGFVNRSLLQQSSHKTFKVSGICEITLMRIILGDHYAPSRWAIKMLLEEEPEFDLIGEVEDGQGLLTLAGENAADLVLFDRELPGIHIDELIARLRALEPRPIVVVMSSEFEYSRMLLKAGADAFVSKADQSDWLLDTLYKYAKQVKIKEEMRKTKKT
jgi:DNA-binding NarL/FixJ family response regulator